MGAGSREAGRTADTYIESLLVRRTVLLPSAAVDTDLSVKGL
jgi:hypothetical protein